MSLALGGPVAAADGSPIYIVNNTQNAIQTIGKWVGLIYLTGLIPVFFLQLVHNEFQLKETIVDDWFVWLFWPVSLVAKLIVSQFIFSGSLKTDIKLEECSWVKRKTLNLAFPSMGDAYCDAMKGLKDLRKKHNVKGKGGLKEAGVSALELKRATACEKNSKVKAPLAVDRVLQPTELAPAPKAG